MGLISSVIGAAAGTVSGVLADTWKEFFYCDALPSDILVKKGQKRIGNKSSNRNGNDNIITSGSGIVVADGQCMIIVDQGKVVEVCAEPGEYTYDASTEPSIFTGNLSDGIMATFQLMGKRFEYGGEAPHDQRVYYFNTKEIVDNKFGTSNPIMFRVVDTNIGLDLDTSVRCNGIYSYRIIDPILFYTNVCGNVQKEYTRADLDPQLKAEFISALQPAFAKISDAQIRPNQIPAHTTELCDIMNAELTKKWSELRGISIVSIAMNPITIPEEDAKIIKEAQKNAINKDPAMAAATLTGAQAAAMQAAANNAGGAMNGFIGMGMAQQAGGVNATDLYNMAAANQQAAAAAAPAPAAAAAPAAPAPEEKPGWICPECGQTNQGNFCTNCGTKRPAGAPLYKCDKCGWEPEDPTHPPKFCPECGDPFTEDDIQK